VIERIELKRQLGLATAAAMVVGEVIAVGIFLTPAEMTKTLGSPLLVLIIWVVMGLMALSGALCYGELAARVPESGGGYAYLREAYGQRLAFLYGWKCFLVMDPGLTAALAVGLAAYAGFIVPLSPYAAKAVAVGAIVVIAIFNILGARVGGRLLLALSFAKVSALAIIILLGFIGQSGDWSYLLPFAQRRNASDPLFAALAGGMVSAFFSFGGWWDLSKMTGEIKDPGHNLPRAIVLGVLAVTVIYITTSFAFMYLVPIEQAQSGETFAAQAGTVLFGVAGGKIFSAVVVVSVLGSLTAVMMSAPRVYFAMARDGLFFRGAAAVHPRFGTPARAIVLQAALAIVLVMLGTFRQIIAYFIFVTVVFIALTVSAVFILRRTNPESKYLAAGYPVTPLFFLGLVSLLLLLLAITNPLEAFLGVMVVGLGLPVFYLVFNRAKPQLE
jgi:APA family basic amino acid/polyamine antiporter